jgi:hypothetical protein
MPMVKSRRQFLTDASLAGAAVLLRARRAVAAEGSLEIRTVRISKDLGSARRLW